VFHHLSGRDDPSGRFLCDYAIFFDGIGRPLEGRPINIMRAVERAHKAKMLSSSEIE